LNKRDMLTMEFLRKMRRFYQYNKRFGHKLMEKEPQTLENLFTNKHTYRASFNDKHVNFREDEDTDYETSHLHIVAIHDDDDDDSDE